MVIDDGLVNRPSTCVPASTVTASTRSAQPVPP